MRLFKIILFLCAFIGVSNPSSSRADDGIKSVTVEGGPIFTKHFQSGGDDFQDFHGLGIVKVHTEGYGNWGLYVLAPNSVNRISVGAGYVTDPYAIPLGPVDLELSAGLGLVTGYQDYPVPLLAGQARLVVYKDGPWDAGISAAAMPYILKEDGGDGGNKAGIVVTTPFLSVRYKFQP